MLTFTNGIWNELSDVIWPAARCHLSAGVSHMCAGKMGLMPLTARSVCSLGALVNLDLCRGAWLWCHLANKHKYSDVSRHAFLCSRVDTYIRFDIDNQTVNRVASNNQLIMNCKWGPSIDPPLAFGMCGEGVTGGLGCQCRWFIKQLPFVRGGLWLWACHLLLLSAVALRLNAKPPPPHKRGKGGRRGANYWTGCLDSVA